jgi:hypothetical protein
MINLERVLLAEHQLMFGHSLAAMCAARDELRVALPKSVLLKVLDARILRKRESDAAPISPTSPWAA